MAVSLAQFGKTLSAQASQAHFTGARPGMILYMGLTLIALLKDLLDFVGLGSLPGIGTVVTMCFSFLIWILMTVFDRSGGKSNNKVARGLVLLLLSLVEAVGFGLNFLPIETFTVIILYGMARSAWKREKKRVEAENAVQNRAYQAEAYRLQAQAMQETAREEATAMTEGEAAEELLRDTQSRRRV